MSLAIVYSRASVGMSAPLVTVEVHISRGIPKLKMVGLPEMAVQESKDRVRSALLNSGFEFPARRITINLAPADLPKEGGRFDLPIALGILAASKQLPSKALLPFEFAGELALSGELRSIRGVLPIAIAAAAANRALIMPEANAAEASRVERAQIFASKHLLEVCAHLQGSQLISPCLPDLTVEETFQGGDLSDVIGQAHARRALEVAASGRHSLLFIGPPGTGKTMLASRLPSILPPLDEEAALEVASIASISSGGFNPSQWRHRPYRSPHHGSSSAALIGGGRPPRPGEISLAHQGVLFLDELPEFERRVLESLREPLESGHVTISRAACQVMFPASFQLVAAMNPCPCGFLGSPRGSCHCSDQQIQRYMTRLSGPLLDRIDMHVEVPGLPPGVLLSAEPSEKSALIRARVQEAHLRQQKRQGMINHQLAGSQLTQYCSMDANASTLLAKLTDRFNLSARVCHRIIRVARTIADMAASDMLIDRHISEAFGYRCLHRFVQPDHQNRS